MKRRYTVSINRIFVIVMCIYVAITFMANSKIQYIFGFEKDLLYSFILKVTPFILFLLYLFEKKYNSLQFIFLVLLGVLVIIIYFNNSTLGVVTFISILFSYPRNLSTKTLSKYVSYTILLVIVSTVLLYYLGYIETDIIYRGAIIRNSCGFVTANSFANTVLLWMVFYSYYKIDNWKYRDFAICIFIAIYTYIQTNSRMAFLLNFLILLNILYYRFFKKKIKGIYFLSTYAFLFLFALCFLITICYLEGVFEKILLTLDVLSSYRISYMAYYYQQYGLTLFGKAIKTVTREQRLATGEKWTGIDNSYMYMLISWGALYSTVQMFLYYKLGKYLKRINNYYGAFCVVVLLILGISEKHLAMTTSNIAIFLMAEMINDRKGEKNYLSSGNYVLG